MKRGRVWMLAAALAAATLGRAQGLADLNLQLGVLWQSWLQAGSGSQAGALLKHFRLRASLDPAPGLRAVVMPELAGGVSLLDGYVSLDLGALTADTALPLPVIATLGQFKTPFGQNRMFAPDQLYAVDYSSINRALFQSASFWDDGLLLTYLNPFLRLDVAALGGLGPNLASPPDPSGFVTKTGADFSGRLETTWLDGSLTLGTSLYQGQGFSAPGRVLSQDSKLWSGAHGRWHPWDWLDLQAEWIGRAGSAWGATGLAAVGLLRTLEAVAYYDHVEPVGAGSSAQARLGGGLNYTPVHGLRFSLQVLSDAVGSLNTAAGGAEHYILQSELRF